MRRKLISDMSRSELLAMRESGMNNREIADALAVSYNTILRMIGKQPKEFRERYSRGG